MKSTEKEVIIGNIMIAEFMGQRMRNLELDEERSGYHYHDSWDWIMPVCIKIESLNKLGGIVTIMQGQCKITSNMLGNKTVYAHVCHYMTMEAEGKLKAVYEAVVTFIKWYNENKPKE